MAEPTRTLYTVKDFLNLPETNTIAELIDGDFILSPMPIAAHQRAVIRAIAFLLENGKAGEVLTAPMALVLSATNTLEPDVFWIAEGNTSCRVEDDGYFHGAPDLVVEVLSPSTAKRDRGIKYRLYEQHSVREYWLVDPEAQFVEVFVRGDNAKFARLGLFEAGETYASPVLAIEVEAARRLG